MVAGADVNIALVPQGLNWTLDSRNYWTTTIAKTSPLNGLWVDGQQVEQVPYRDLALKYDRAFALIPESETENRIYYKGTETLFDVPIETAANPHVLRVLKEATAEIERHTEQQHSRSQIYRETHRGLKRSQQLVTRHRPVAESDRFRVDCYGPSRTLYRRFNEQDIQRGVMHVDGEAGMVTLSQALYDWQDWAASGVSIEGGLHTRFLKGENNIELTYLAGYDRIPLDLQEAASLIAAKKLAVYWNTAISGGLSGLSLGCVNLNFSELFSRWFEMWDQRVSDILSHYQHFEIEVY
jgi:hypothetical protein